MTGQQVVSHVLFPSPEEGHTWPTECDKQLGLLQDLAVWIPPTTKRSAGSLRGERAHAVLGGAGLGMPLGRSEAWKEFITFLIVWLKSRECKAQAVVTDGDLRCFVKCCPVFWEAWYLYKPALKPPTHTVSLMGAGQNVFNNIFLAWSSFFFTNQNMQPSDLQRPTASSEVLGGRFAKVQGGGLPRQVVEKSLKYPPSNNFHSARALTTRFGVMKNLSAVFVPVWNKNKC